MAIDLPRGALAPAASLFDSEGELALGRFGEQVEWLIAEGIDGIVVAGSTGEGYALDIGELVALTDQALAVTGGRVPVLASIIADDTRAACRRAEALRGKGLAAIQVTPPHYIFPTPDEALVAFYAAVAQTADCPVLIYNAVPWASVSPTLAGEIVGRCEGVVGVKQSLRDMSAFVALTRSVGAERLYAAIDPALMSCYALGCVGSISALSTVAPGATSALFSAVERGDMAAAMMLHRRLAGLCRALEGSDMPAQVKALLEIQGVAAGAPRLPLQPLSPERRQHAAAVYREFADGT